MPGPQTPPRCRGPVFPAGCALWAAALLSVGCDDRIADSPDAGVGWDAGGTSSGSDGGDVTAPGISGGSPAGVLAAGTTLAALAVATDEQSSCRYGFAAGTAFDVLPGAFASGDGHAHTAELSVADGERHTVHVRCRDAAGNANDTDYVIEFSVALPPGAFPPGYRTSRLGSSLLAGNDFQGLGSLADLQATGIFNVAWDGACSVPPRGDDGFTQYSGRPGRVDPEGPYIQLVTSDPTFGKVVQLWWPHCTGSGSTPAAFHVVGAANFPPQTGALWFRATYKWRSGYTTVGAYPTGAANSHKHMFLTWAGGVGGRMQWEYSNTSQYILGFGQTGKTGIETPLPGSGGWSNANTGPIREWFDDQWWEFIFAYSIETPGPNGVALARFWKRPLTEGGVIVDKPWEFAGLRWEYTNGSTPAEGSGVKLLANRNKTVDPPGGHQIWVGPWEVSNAVDPYGLDHQGR